MTYTLTCTKLRFNKDGQEKTSDGGTAAWPRLGTGGEMEAGPNFFCTCSCSVCRLVFPSSAFVVSYLFSSLEQEELLSALADLLCGQQEVGGWYAGLSICHRYSSPGDKSPPK